MGGANPPTGLKTDSQTYDGTVWASNPSTSTARQKGGGIGTQALGLYFGGLAPPTPANDATNVSEEYTHVTSAAEAADVDFD